MMYCIAVFRSRSQTMSFSALLKSYGVDALVINTPRRVNVSCGISVKFPMAKLPDAKSILSRRNFSTFARFFQIIPLANGDVNVVPV